MNILPFSKLFFVCCFSLVLSLIQHLLSTCSIPGTLVGGRGSLLNKTIRAPLMSVQSWTGFPLFCSLFFHSCIFLSFSFSTLSFSYFYSFPHFLTSFPFFLWKLLKGFPFYFRLVQDQQMRLLSLHCTLFPWEFRDIHNFWPDLAVSVPPLRKIGCQLMRVSFPLLPWNHTLLPFIKLPNFVKSESFGERHLPVSVYKQSLIFVKTIF